ncbi:hypothetical protein SKM57_09735 [Acinetobacter faecalis]|uniref:hypothetical protein n=1 Tax=Acinetobacter faecalis TaxID=2665161 RepID=UPI002A91AC34|nr:hypothetical protein [Acinetobacter faecalis]MDY6468858.1 hypothetical protein [Acinetobacter faecalis]
MLVLVSLILLFIVSTLLGIFYFYKKYNSLTRADKNVRLIINGSAHSAKRDLEDVRGSLKNLKEQANNI